ncbi:conserved hypothetical protein [Methanocaldococcus sp. FS406-22]|uniref:hypothetical protein n=1 Tax=Methanocaldococcus sp. (strain FS406-22) TaxID=644281 RepID=UPI0001BF47C8|nr:hypothetical protein [Methanocaldococcus sp. FS406-22]ADC69667.1 conserved hypothetical protein [Methanocaldococcus sp. FS406-22]
MEKVYSKFGRIEDLKEIISGLADFTGIIRIDNALLYYINSKLISSKLNGREKSLEEIFSQIPEEFLIEIYQGNEEEVKTALRNFKPDKPIVEISKLSLVFEDEVILNSYNDIFKYLTYINKVIFMPKRFKNEKAVIIYKNKKEVFAVYFGKKTLFGKRAISKLKTTFAVSEISAKIERTSDKELNSLKNQYPKGVLLFGESINDVVKKITAQKKPEILENASLIDALSYGTCLIKIEGSEIGYIIAKDGKPVYAFLNEYDGDKSYRLLKSMCIVEDVKYYIYKLSKEEYDMFKSFEENRITTS